MQSPQPACPHAAAATAPHPGTVQRPYPAAHGRHLSRWWLGLSILLLATATGRVRLTLTLWLLAVAVLAVTLQARRRRQRRIQAFANLKPTSPGGTARPIPVHGALATFFDIAVRRRTQLRDIDLQRRQRYGAIYLLFYGRTPMVVVTTAKLAAQISHQLDVFAKSDPRELAMPFYYRWVGNDNVVLANGAIWRRIRRITHPPLNTVHLFAPIFHAKAGVLCAGLEQQLQHSPDPSCADLPLKRWLKAVSLDSAGVALFGFDFKHLHEQRNPGIDALDFILEEVFRPIRRLLPIMNRLPLRSNQRLQEAMNHLDTLVMDMIQALKQDPQHSAQNHVLQLMLAENAQAHLSNAELRHNIIAMVLASHETTQVALGGVLYHLAKYPLWQQRIRAEAQALFPDLEAAFASLGRREDGSYQQAYRQLQTFDSLSHFILESMRVYSPLANQNPRTTTCDTELDGYAIPAGSLVSINIHAVHMDPASWEQPERFDPDRFKDERLPFSAAYLPFGTGPRICAGRLFSLMEQKIVVCHLLRQFQLELPTPDYRLPLLRNSFTGMHADSFHLRVRRLPARPH